MKLTKKEHFQEAQDILNLLPEGKKSYTETAKTLCKKYNVKYNETIGRLVRKWFGNKKEIRLEDTKEFKEAAAKDFGDFKKYTIITACQNATPINQKVWKSILTYADFLDARLEVILMRYKNPTSVFTDKQEKQEFWAKEIRTYSTANRHKIHDKVVVVGDLKIQLTASTPLSGMEGLSADETCIIGHPRQHFKPTPWLEGQTPKFMATTGVVSLENYTDSKAGKKGEFHHTFGFVIVEDLGDGNFNFRQVSIEEDGTFYDLDYKVKDGKVKQKNCVEAVVFGDLHLGEATCQTSLQCGMEMLDRFKPKHVVLHDIMDGIVVNPHELNDPFILADKEEKGLLSIKKEVDDVLEFLHSVINYNPIVVKSNHDIFVDRFLLGDWRKGVAKKDYLEYAYLRSTGKLPNGILPYEIEKRFGDKVICLKEDSSFKIQDIEVGQHGHLGVAGSKGGITQFKRLNTKIILGHTHKPTKEDGCMYVGTNTKLKLNYTKGLSEWWNSNVIIHKNGKAQNLLIFNGQYTTI